MIRNNLNQKRLTLIASDPGISAALLILSASRMILIYLNYRFWLRTWKIIYAKFLDSFILDRDRDVIQSLNQGRSDRGSWNLQLTFHSFNQNFRHRNFVVGEFHNSLSVTQFLIASKMSVLVPVLAKSTADREQIKCDYYNNDRHQIGMSCLTWITCLNFIMSVIVDLSEPIMIIIRQQTVII